MSTTSPSASTNWEQTFSDLFHAGVKRYQAGHQKAAGLVDEKDAAFLGTIGYTIQEFFDFVEDYARGGEPTLGTARKIPAGRRDYFLNEQGGVRSQHVIDMAKLPSKDAQVDGIGWLPRLIPKAEAKLRGEMPPDLMYGCGGDRGFFPGDKVES